LRQEPFRIFYTPLQTCSLLTIDTIAVFLFCIVLLCVRYPSQESMTFSPVSDRIVPISRLRIAFFIPSEEETRFHPRSFSALDVPCERISVCASVLGLLFLPSPSIRPQSPPTYPFPARSEVSFPFPTPILSFPPILVRVPSLQCCDCLLPLGPSASLCIYFFLIFFFLDISSSDYQFVPHSPSLVKARAGLCPV